VMKEEFHFCDPFYRGGINVVDFLSREFSSYLGAACISHCGVGRAMSMNRRLQVDYILEGIRNPAAEFTEPEGRHRHDWILPAQRDRLQLCRLRSTSTSRGHRS